MEEGGKSDNKRGQTIGEWLEYEQEFLRKIAETSRVLAPMLGISVIEISYSLDLAQIHSYIRAFSKDKEPNTLKGKYAKYKVPEKYQKKMSQA